jgi:hypothetical protein
VPEVVDDGVTGFIVPDETAAVSAIGRLHELSRTGVRRRFEQRFTSKRMAESYVHIYRELVAEKTVHPRQPSVFDRWSRWTGGEQPARVQAPVGALNGQE